jgi:hypothetical protein
MVFAEASVHRELMSNLNRHSILCKSFPQLSVYDQDCRPRDGVALRSYCRNTHDIIPPPFHLQHQVPRSASQNVGMASCRDFASGTSRHVRVRTFKGKQGRALGRAVTDQGNVWRCANGSLLLAGHCGSFAGRPPGDRTMTTERVTPGLPYHTLTARCWAVLPVYIHVYLCLRNAHGCMLDHHTSLYSLAQQTASHTQL